MSFNWQNYYASGDGNAVNVAKAQSAWGAQMLVPAIAQGSGASNGIRDLGTKLGLNTSSELIGTEAFVEYINKNGITITNALDVWKYATFITYIADSRDLSAIQFSQSPFIPSSASLDTNLMQSANYTLTTFSGECSSYTRLYCATETNMGIENYFVSIIPKDTSKSGHAVPLFHYNNQWHVMNYYYDYYISDSYDPMNVVAYIWATVYNQGWSGYYLIPANNVWYVPNQAMPASFIPSIVVYDVDYAINLGVIKPNAPINSIDYSYTPQYITTQNIANSLFQIQSYGSNLIGLITVIGLLIGIFFTLVLIS